MKQTSVFARIIHFTLGGVLLFAGSRLMPVESAVPAGEAGVVDQVVFTKERLAMLRERHAQETGVTVASVGDDQFLDAAIEEEILYREALRRGLDHSDRSVRYRLVEKMRFIVGHHAEASDDELYQRALELNLGRDDMVLRRLLVSKLQLILKLKADVSGFDEIELRDYMERNAQKYPKPARADFRQLFFSVDRRGRGQAQRDAEDFFASLDLADADASGGDPPIWGAQFSRQSPVDISKRFGELFSDHLFESEIGRWLKPFSSAYGSHLIFVRSKTASGTSEFEQVRSQVSAGLKAERQEEALVAQLEEIRARYEVIVHDGANSGEPVR